MTESTKPERDEIAELLDTIEDSGWVVRDYNPDVDPESPLSVSLAVERPIGQSETGTSKEQREAIRTVRECVQKLEDEFDEGAPVDAVIDLAQTDSELTRSRIDHEIGELKQQGEVYEPRTDHLRST